MWGALLCDTEGRGNAAARSLHSPCGLPALVPVGQGQRPGWVLAFPCGVKSVGPREKQGPWGPVWVLSERARARPRDSRPDLGHLRAGLRPRGSTGPRTCKDSSTVLLMTQRDVGEVWGPRVSGGPWSRWAGRWREGRVQPQQRCEGGEVGTWWSGLRGPTWLRAPTTWDAGVRALLDREGSRDSEGSGCLLRVTQPGSEGSHRKPGLLDPWVLSGHHEDAQVGSF